jgi:hypothetical protein
MQSAWLPRLAAGRACGDRPTDCGLSELIADSRLLIVEVSLKLSICAIQAHINNRNSSGASQSPERRGRRSQVSNNKQKGETESEQLKATGETRREPSRPERIDHPPEASLGWRPEMASSSVGSEP